MNSLISHVTATRRFIMQKARRHIHTMLRPLVGAWFQELFHSPARGSFHLSFTVFVRYRSHGSIYPNRMGPLDSHRIFRAPRYSGYHYNHKQKRIRGFHPLWPYFPACSAISFIINVVILQPRLCRNIIGLGYSPFARHYLGNHYYFLFLQVLRCFSSLRSPPYLLIWIPLLRWVFPFGHLRVTGYLRLTAAFRSLSRPSSPP